MADLIVVLPATSSDTVDRFTDCFAQINEGGSLEICQTPRLPSDPPGVSYVVRKRYSPIGWLECEEEKPRG